jgi:hypothetical protein
MNAAHNVKPGDKVRLVSDNPLMTVTATEGQHENGIAVVYMHEGKIINDVVPPAALVKVAPNEMPPSLSKR